MVEAHRVIGGLHAHGLLAVITCEELVVVGLAAPVRGPGSGKANGLHIVAAHGVASQTQAIERIGVVIVLATLARVRAVGILEHVKMPAWVLELDRRVGKLRCCRGRSDLVIICRGECVVYLVLKLIVPTQLKLVLGVCHVGVQIARTVIGAHIIKAILGGKANILRGIVALVTDRLAVIAHAQKLRLVTAIAAVGRSLQHVLLVSTRTCP